MHQRRHTLLITGKTTTAWRSLLVHQLLLLYDPRVPSYQLFRNQAIRKISLVSPRQTSFPVCFSCMNGE